MTPAGQPDATDGSGDAGVLAPPVRDLLEATASVLEAWLVRSVVATATRRLGSCPDELRTRAEAMAREAAPVVLEQLRALLATDVDAQRGNPLAVLRAAVVHPTRVLREADVPPPVRDEFAATSFPDDVYDLGPATWADVDESLREPGIVWGAWKAATVLRRRREEGLR